jgi:hypothetical protein
MGCVYHAGHEIPHRFERPMWDRHDSLSSVREKSARLRETLSGDASRRAMKSQVSGGSCASSQVSESRRKFYLYYDI